MQLEEKTFIVMEGLVGVSCADGFSCSPNFPAGRIWMLMVLPMEIRAAMKMDVRDV